MKPFLSIADVSEAMGIARAAIRTAFDAKTLVMEYRARIKRAHDIVSGTEVTQIPPPASGILGGVFISYRRHDATAAKALKTAIHTELTNVISEKVDFSHQTNKDTHALSAEAAEQMIFLDSDILKPGDDFPKMIDIYMARSTVYVILIGEKWSPKAHTSISTEFTADGDWVTKEVESALSRHLVVLPILIGTAIMPSSDSLPNSIKALSNLNAIKYNGASEQAKAISKEVIHHILSRSEDKLNDYADSMGRLLAAGGRRLMIENGPYVGDIGILNSQLEIRDSKQATIENIESSVALPHGIGTHYTQVGTITGIWANGLLFYGKTEYLDGDYFEGEMREGRRHGLGIYQFHDGRIFIGNHLKGKSQGLGVSLSRDGYVFAGEYRDAARYVGILMRNGFVQEVTDGGQPYHIPPIPAPAIHDLFENLKE